MLKIKTTPNTEIISHLERAILNKKASEMFITALIMKDMVKLITKTVVQIGESSLRKFL